MGRPPITWSKARESSHDKGFGCVQGGLQRFSMAAVRPGLVVETGRDFEMITFWYRYCTSLMLPGDVDKRCRLLRRMYKSQRSHRDLAIQLRLYSFDL